MIDPDKRNAVFTLHQEGMAAREISQRLSAWILASIMLVVVTWVVNRRRGCDAKIKARNAHFQFVRFPFDTNRLAIVLPGSQHSRLAVAIPNFLPNVYPIDATKLLAFCFLGLLSILHEQDKWIGAILKWMDRIRSVKISEEMMLIRLFRRATYSFTLLSVTLLSTGIGLSSSLAQSENEAEPTEDLTAQTSPIAYDSSSCDGLSSESFGYQNWLNGDQSRFRRELADNGIKFTNNLTNFYYGNTTGGIEREFRFSGHGDYLANIDINKLGGPQGQFLQIRAEHRYGESLAGATGAFLPPNLAADLPVADSNNVYLTNFLFTQALSENFAIYGGKLDTLDGDMNAFAHGRGIRQFSNSAFVVNPIGLRTVAYSTLGTGFVILNDLEPIYNFLVLNARDTTESDGFSELFADGAVISQELRLPTNFFGLPGHQLFGAIWSSRNFVSLDQSPLVVLPSVPIARQSGSWALTYNFDQYLFVDPCDSKKGWGLFGRAGVADPDTNPIQYFLSLGVGGNSRLRGRENDSFGMGWYYSGTSRSIAPFLASLGNLGDGQGGELFYNFAVGKRLSITTDTQVLLPARSNIDTSLICGLRANLNF